MSDARPNPGRILALDVGMRRVGLAVSDPLGITAQGLETFWRTNVREDVGRLARLIAEMEVVQMVVGYPLHMSGDVSRQAGLVKEFATKLEARCHIPVTYWDERLTSVEAQRILRAGGASSDKRTGHVDRLSAVLILQSYLDSLPQGDGEWPDAE